MNNKEILELIKETLKETNVNKFAIQIEWDKVRVEVEKSYSSGSTNWFIYTDLPNSCVDLHWTTVSHT